MSPSVCVLVQQMAQQRRSRPAQHRESSLTAGAQTLLKVAPGVDFLYWCLHSIPVNFSVSPRLTTREHCCAVVVSLTAAAFDGGNKRESGSTPKRTLSAFCNGDNSAWIPIPKQSQKPATTPTSFDLGSISISIHITSCPHKALVI